MDIPKGKKRDIKKLLNINIDKLLDGAILQNELYVREQNKTPVFQLKHKFLNIFDTMSIIIIGGEVRRLGFQTQAIENRATKELMLKLSNEYGIDDYNKTSEWFNGGYYGWWFKDESHERTENMYYEPFFYGIVLAPGRPNEKNKNNEYPSMTTLFIMSYDKLDLEFKEKATNYLKAKGFDNLFDYQR